MLIILIRTIIIVRHIILSSSGPLWSDVSHGMKHSYKPILSADTVSSLFRCLVERSCREYYRGLSGALLSVLGYIVFDSSNEAMLFQ